MLQQLPQEKRKKSTFKYIFVVSIYFLFNFFIPLTIFSAIHPHMTLNKSIYRLRLKFSNTISVL